MKYILFTLIGILALMSVGAYIWILEHRESVLEIYVFSLKNGRAMLVRTPDDRRILIDGGSNAEIIRHLTEIIPFYSRRLDAVMVTNTDGKNVSGLVDVFNRYDVDTVYVPISNLYDLGLVDHLDPTYEIFIDLVEKPNIKMLRLSAGDEIFLDRDGEVSMRILFPTDLDDFQYSKASAPEILFRISYGDTSLVFLGGASTKIQKYIYANYKSKTNDSIKRLDGLSIQTDVLVVSHNASSDQFSLDLIDILRPKNLIYSKLAQKKSSSPVSKKTPDPFPWILSDHRFNLREVGTIKITSDGKGVEVIKF